jgi:hypothetical protein
VIGAYLRIVFFIVALGAALVLALFAFTTAALVVFIAVVIAALFGKHKTGVWVVSRESWTSTRRDAKVIDHDPSDLPGPPDRR